MRQLLGTWSGDYIYLFDMFDDAKTAQSVANSVSSARHRSRTADHSQEDAALTHGVSRARSAREGSAQRPGSVGGQVTTGMPSRSPSASSRSRSSHPRTDAAGTRPHTSGEDTHQASSPTLAAPIMCEGAEAFNCGDYTGAISAYTQQIHQGNERALHNVVGGVTLSLSTVRRRDAERALAYRNRAVAYLHRGEASLDFISATRDASRSVTLDELNADGWWRGMPDEQGRTCVLLLPPQIYATIWRNLSTRLQHGWNILVALQQLEEMRAHKEHELRICDELLAEAKDARERSGLKSHRRRIQAQMQQDVEEIQREETKRRLLLDKSVTNYLRCLSLTDRFDLCVFRLMSLWFAHSDDSQTCSVVAELLPSVSSHKFLPLSYQMSARMENATTDFQQQLRALVCRTAGEHPYHALYQIIALRNTSGKQSSTIGAANAVGGDDRSRADAASLVLDTLRANRQLTETIDEMNRLSAAYVEVAMFRLIREKVMQTVGRGYIQLDRRLSLPRVGALPRVPVTTIDLPVQPTGQYANFVSIRRFSSRFRVVGGINLPKIIECEGSDGRRYTQLASRLCTQAPVSAHG
ncbi:hypothetical protein THASP1DRAFT_33272 [Thamnocephalis sphaerospora]|uniref:FAT domain-containing protein n=1 Tax=Thamnocephalis sphaerospora TaxID=78915 RepID=A0A4P9XHY2_9FUNG|nr:hypothetical protein THASP1DRAFT_33272 [Thamnocephalis sphaerospora]|eukprot:RKP04911.1 hypothetical protein THASP1DRAFT_33272 [Thamnocephalis sphaerospora]